MNTAIRPHSGNPIIECKNGDVQVCFKTGRISFRKIKQTRKSGIVYNPRQTAPLWSDFVSQVFAVNAEPSAMAAHFHEFAALMMYPSRTIKINWILWGHERSGKYQLCNVIRPLFQADKIDDITDTNRQPRLTDDWPQYDRLSIPFDRTFSKAELDPVDIERIATTELPGIFNLCLQGIQRVILNGINQPGECGEALEKWERRGGHVPRFLHECCFRQPDIGNRTEGAKIYNRYEGWRPPFGQIYGRSKLFGEMVKLGVEREKRNDRRAVFKDIIIRAKSSRVSNHGQMSACGGQ